MRRGIGSCVTGILAVVGLCTLAMQATAEDDMAYHDLVTLESTLELGTLFTSTNDFKFGDYTGLRQQGFSVLGNADIRRRSAYDAERPYYLRLRGLNLGLESRRVDALFEMPGRFGLFFLLDEIPKYQTDDAASPYLGTGSNTLTLPPGWVPGINPPPLTRLQTSLHSLSVDHKRRTLGGGASIVLMDGLSFDASYKRQTKKGEKLTAGVFGNNGGDPRSIIIPERLDYVTHQIDSHLSYATDQFQVQLQYYGSGFENDEPWLRWQNPYLDDDPPPANASTWDPAAEYPAFGQKGTPPDNWFHQGVFSAGVNLPMNSRLMLNTAFGWGRQHDDFLPYTIIPNFSVPPTRGLPRDDLDGRIRTGMANVRFVSNPLPKLGVVLAYRWDERDNDTPVDTYFRVLNDTGTDEVGDPDQDPANRLINRPYGWDKHHADFDLSYQILPRTKLTLSYDWEQMERTHQEVERMSEHTAGWKLVSQPHRRVRVGARFQYGQRNEHGYNCVRPLVETEPPDLLTDAGCTPSQEFENHPDLRKFNQADRRRTTAHLWSNFALRDDLAFGISSRYTHDDYFDSELGLTDFRSFSPGFDLSYTPTDRVRFNVFYQYEETRSKMDSVEWVSFGGPAATDPFNPANGWSNRDKDIIHTAGAGLEVVAIPERLTLNLDYLFARSREIYDVSPNAGNPSGGTLFPFPDATTQLHDISVRSELQLTRNLSLRLGYLFEHYRSRDWAYDRVCPACLDFSASSAVIATGEQPPEYDVHVGSVSVILSFW